MQKIRAKLFLLLLPALILISTFAAKNILAQATPLDISSSTVLFEYNPKPNAEIEDTVRLRNNSNAPTNLKVGLKILEQGANGEPILKDLADGDDFKDSITFEKDRIRISANGSADIPFNIKIPQEAAFGYYYTIVITQDETAEEGTVRFVGELAIPLIINVQKPGAKIEASVVNFQPKSKVNEYLPVEFETQIKNLGNVSTKVRGNIFVKGLRGNELAILEVNPGNSRTLPQAGNIFTSSWEDGFLVREPVVEDNEVIKEENKSVKTNLKVNWNKLTSFRFGKYTADLLLVYDDGTRDVVLEGTTSFWIVPYKIIIAIVISVALIIFIFKKLLSSYVKSQIKKQNQAS